MTSTSTMIIALTIMLSINIGLAFLQEGVDQVVEQPDFFNVSDSPYSNYVVNNQLVVNDSQYLPSDENVEQDDTGNILTDTYKNIKNWVTGTLAPLGFVGSTLKQPYGFMNDIGVPASVSAGFGALWYLIMLVILVSWFMGR